MSKLKRASRKLDPKRVQSAILIHDKRKELAFNMIRERISSDIGFAKDVIAAVGEGLPKDIREIAEKTISNSNGCSAVYLPKEELVEPLETLNT